jgi:AcrR family transcriptional regulator
MYYIVHRFTEKGKGMGKAFSVSEKAAVKKRLKEKGVELFSKFGLKKTSIDDITRSAGIGRGTFYLFYRSKEDFFLSIIEETEQTIKKNIMGRFSGPQKSISSTFREFLYEAFAILDKNPLLYNILNNKEEFDMLIRSLPAGRLSSFLTNDNRVGEAILKKFASQGIKLPVSSLTFSGILRSIYLLRLHKDLIGIEIYPKVMEFFTESIASNLLKDIKAGIDRNIF